MRTLLPFLFRVLAFQIFSICLSAQPTVGSRSVMTNASGDLLANFTVPSGRTVTFASGAAIVLPDNALSIADVSGLQTALDSKPTLVGGFVQSSQIRFAEIDQGGIVFSGGLEWPTTAFGDNVPTNTEVLTTLAAFRTSNLAAANTYTNAAQIAPAWRLSAYAGSETLPANVSGMGWDGAGRFTLQSPAGALQLYSVGAPAVPTIYWPGNIVANTITATTNASLVSAANITTGLGSDALNLSVMTNSLVPPLRQWQGTTIQAGTVGIPTQSDAEGGGGGSTELVNGTYWPQAVVSGMTGATSSIAGLYRTSAQVRTDLAVPQVVAAPATATSTGTAGQIAYDASYFYVCTATNTWVRAALSTW